MRKLKMRNKKFVEVFERYQKLVMKLVYDKSSDMELAKEICQHTFFNYYLHMDKVKDELIKPWLIMTAKNAIVDNYRKIPSRKECPLIHVETIVWKDVPSVWWARNFLFEFWRIFTKPM